MKDSEKAGGKLFNTFADNEEDRILDHLEPAS